MDDKEYIGSTIKGLCVPQRLLYPKLELEELPPGSFGVLEVDVGSVLEGSIPATYNTGWVENPMYTICVQGLLPPLEKDETYYFECIVAPPKNPKYGLNFNLTRMNKQVRLTGTEQRKMFLESILTEHQIELLYDSLPDPFKTIDEGDLYTLSSIKGIGRVTAEKMLEKYTLNKNDIDAFLVLREEYGLTDTAVAKLHEKYHSTDTIIAKLRENPYELMEARFGSFLDGGYVGGNRLFFEFVEMACSLLRGTTQSIAEVAYNCGFSTPSGLNRLFAKIIGVTPTDYRKLK